MVLGISIQNIYMKRSTLFKYNSQLFQGDTMKKTNLLLMVLSPILIGLLFNNFLLFIPLVIYAAPFLMIAYWFWVGTKFTENIMNPIKAIVVANAIGIMSLALYYWQFIIVADKERNLILAGFSQMFTAPLSYLTARSGVIFEQTPNEITQVTFLAMQVTGLILMIIVFSSGYFFKKNNLKQQIS
jgi:hypothetical protein